MNRRRRRMAKKNSAPPMKEETRGASPPSSPEEVQGGSPQSTQGDPAGGLEREAGSLINSGGPVPQQAESATIGDPILRQAELKIENQILPKYKQAYMKVVVVGLKLAMGNNGALMSSIQHSKDPIIDCARGAVNLTLIMFKESRNTMPPQALVPAAMTLMLKALDFCDKSGVAKIGTPELDRATTEFYNFLLHRWNLTPQKMRVLAEHVHRVMADPEQVELLARKAGVTRDPRTLTIPQGGVPPAPSPTAPPAGRPSDGI